jgi:hypothetical protein
MQDKNIENKKDEILNSIIEYIKSEDFPPEHLIAIKKIVTVFNWSDESEKKIFDFAEYIGKRFSVGIKIKKLVSENEHLINKSNNKDK